MENNKFQGIVPILAAPFTDEGEVSYDDLRRIIDFLVEAGSHAIALFGIASEFYKLSDDEQTRMVDVLVSRAAGRVPTVVSITKHSTELAVKYAKYAERVGIDGLMVLPPHFLGPSEAAVKEHILAIAQMVDIPLIVQYNPAATNMSIGSEFFLQLAESCDKPIYIKLESDPPGHLVSQFVEKSGGKLDILIGNAGRQMVDTFGRGAVGVMPGCSMPEIYVEIYRRFKEGALGEMRRVHNELINLLNVIAQSPEMIIKFEKMILKRRGVIESDYCRAPSFEPDGRYVELFEQYYQPVTRFFKGDGAHVY